MATISKNDLIVDDSGSNIHYQLYIKNTMLLAESIVLKSADNARLLNVYIQKYFPDYPVNEEDPKTWKYYLNISGEYHPSDDRIYIVSMDTQETILFSKENFKVHRATAKAYGFGKRHYRELISMYPNRTLLINGVLFPADIDAAIAANDGDILAYPSEFVEAHEYNFIPKLQQWITTFYNRWYNEQYGVSDELWPAMFLGQLYLTMVPAILNIRLSACKTNEAHSYHINQYLAGHNQLHQFTNELNLEQKLFLYRNIKYIQRNAGKSETFEWLVENMMTKRNLPLAQNVAKHVLSNQPTELLPAIGFFRKDINSVGSSESRMPRALSTILDMEDPLATDNQIYKSEYYPVIKERFENSLSNTHLTKAIESSKTDYSSATPYTKTDVLLNHWLHLAANDKYTAYVYIEHPKLKDRYSLTVRDAYILYFFCFCWAYRIQITEVPTFVSQRVQRIPLPTADEMLDVVETRFQNRSLAEDLLYDQPDLPKIISIQTFREKCESIFATVNFQRFLIATYEHKNQHAQMRSMINRLYADCTYSLEPAGTLYEDWFAERGIVFEDFEELDYRTLALDILNQATGNDLIEEDSLSQLQKSMIAILTRLSSYSIQFMAKVHTSDLWVMNNSGIRFGDTPSKSYSSVDARIIVAKPYRTFNHVKNRSWFDIGSAKRNSRVRGYHKSRTHYDSSVTLSGGKNRKVDQSYMSGAPIRFGYLAEEQIYPGIWPIPGMNKYMGLTPAERINIRDVYSECFPVHQLYKPDFAQLFVTNILDGLYFQ